MGSPMPRGREGEVLQPLRFQPPPLPARAQCKLKKWLNETTGDPAPPAFSPTAPTVTPQETTRGFLIQMAAVFLLK